LFLQITNHSDHQSRKTDAMQMGQSPSVVKSVRELLPTRRFNRSLSIECEGHSYRATAGFFDDGRIAEIFLHAPGKMGTPLQANADTAAILASLLLQYGVAPEVVLHSITGPIAVALQKFVGETP
jgi:hypothetical protein